MLRGSTELVFAHAANAPAERVAELLERAKDLGLSVDERTVKGCLGRDEIEVAGVVARELTGREAELSFATFACLFPHWAWRYQSTALLQNLVGRLDEVPWSRWPARTRAAVAESCELLRAILQYFDADSATKDARYDEHFDDLWLEDDPEWRAAATSVLERFGNAAMD
jgi:hypothetical protein